MTKMLRKTEAGFRGWSYPHTSLTDHPFDRLVTIRVPESGVDLAAIVIRGDTTYVELSELKRAVFGLDEWVPEEEADRNEAKG